MTEHTHGNAVGIECTDFITQRIFNRIDFDSTYANCLTCTVTSCVRIPGILENDRQAILAAIKTCNTRDSVKTRDELNV